MDLGYAIVLQEVWHYDTTDEQLFASYISNF